MLVCLLAVSAFTISAQASYILDCTTLGGKDVKIQYAYDGTKTVLEKVSFAGQSDIEATSFVYSRSGVRITLSNGLEIREDNGQVNQMTTTGEAKAIACHRSSTEVKVEPKEL